MLVNDGGKKLLTARANTSGFAAPVSQNAPSTAQQLLVADFNGDLFADAGLFSDVGGGNAKLEVMVSTADGTFGAAQDWWQGTLDLSSDFEAAGDANGDGKADLITRSAATGTYSVALSRASCSPIGPLGPCAPENIGAPGLRAAVPWSTQSWAASDVKNVVGDFDRDGRDDLIAVVKDGSGIKVQGMRAHVDGTGFVDPQLLWSGSLAFADLQPAALNVNPDGMADLALLFKNGTATSIQWLRTNERTVAPATMTAMQAFSSSLPWNSGNKLL
jgi:hypothetical protein